MQVKSADVCGCYYKIHCDQWRGSQGTVFVSNLLTLFWVYLLSKSVFLPCGGRLHPRPFFSPSSRSSTSCGQALPTASSPGPRRTTIRSTDMLPATICVLVTANAPFRTQSANALKAGRVPTARFGPVPRGRPGRILPPPTTRPTIFLSAATAERAIETREGACASRGCSRGQLASDGAVPTVAP